MYYCDSKLTGPSGKASLLNAKVESMSSQAPAPENLPQFKLDHNSLLQRQKYSFIKKLTY